MNAAGSPLDITVSTNDAARITTAAAGVAGTDLHILLLIEGNLPPTISDREEIAKKLEDCNFTVCTASSILEGCCVIMDKNLDENPIDLVIVDNQEVMDIIISKFDLPVMEVRIFECVDYTDPDAIEYSIMSIKEEKKLKIQEYALEGKRKYQDSLEQDQDLEHQQLPQKKPRENLHYEKQNENQVDIHFNEHSVEMSEPIPMEQLETNQLPINQGFPSKLNAIIDGSFQTVENDIRSWSFEELYSIMLQEEHEHQHYEKQKENQVEINVNEQLQTNQVSFNHGFTSILNAIIDGSFDADESDIINWNFEEPYNIIMPKEQHENLHYENIEKQNEHSFEMTELVSLKQQADELSIDNIDGSFQIIDTDINSWSYEELYNILPQEQHEKQGQKSEQKIQNQVETIDEISHANTSDPKIDANTLAEANQFTNIRDWLPTFIVAAKEYGITEDPALIDFSCVEPFWHEDHN